MKRLLGKKNIKVIAFYVAMTLVLNLLPFGLFTLVSSARVVDSGNVYLREVYTENLTVEGNATVTVTGTINGNVYINYGRVDLDGGTINGNVYISRGKFYVYGEKPYVSGNVMADNSESNGNIDVSFTNLLMGADSSVYINGMPSDGYNTDLTVKDSSFVDRLTVGSDCNVNGLGTVDTLILDANSIGYLDFQQPLKEIIVENFISGEYVYAVVNSDTIVSNTGDGYVYIKDNGKTYTISPGANAATLFPNQSDFEWSLELPRYEYGNDEGSEPGLITINNTTADPLLYTFSFDENSPYIISDYDSDYVTVTPPGPTADSLDTQVGIHIPANDSTTLEFNYNMDNLQIGEFSEEITVGLVKDDYSYLNYASLDFDGTLTISGMVTEPETVIEVIEVVDEEYQIPDETGVIEETRTETKEEEKKEEIIEEEKKEEIIEEEKKEEEIVEEKQEEIVEKEEKKEELPKKEVKEEKTEEKPELVIEKRQGECSVTASNVYFGGQLNITSSSPTNGNNASYRYKVKNMADSTYSNVQPANVGNYTVEATFPANERYEETKAYADFSIGYLPTPAEAYSKKGTTGKDNYYTTDVVITPPEGFLISTTLNGNYLNSLTITNSTQLGNVFLKSEATGEMTDAIAIDAIKIDKDKPVISCDDNKIYAETYAITISDDNLMSVLVDGKEVQFTGNTKTIELDAEGGSKSVKVKVVDKAGNATERTIEICSEWMKDMVIPTGKSVRLQSGISYKLGSGQWTVSGDSDTVYEGNIDFVVSDGSYTFEAR